MDSAEKPAKRERCEAKTRSGGNCKRPAGAGTDHVGFGCCKLHGGCVPNQIKHAQKAQAKEAVATYGLPIEVDPHTALINELHRTAGHVAYLRQIVAELEHDDLKQRQVGENGTIERPAVWVQLYADERKHLAAVAKTCIQVGIEERRVQLAEEQGQLFAQVIRGILEDSGVDPTSKDSREIVRRHLALVA